MTDDEILSELAQLPPHQQPITSRIWEVAGSKRVRWVCGDEDAAVQEINCSREYFCRDCRSIQMGL